MSIQTTCRPPNPARDTDARTLEMIRGLDAKIARLQAARAARLASINRTATANRTAPAEASLAPRGPARRED